MEFLIVTVIIIASIAYAVSRIIRMMKAKNSPCHDCPGCTLKAQMQGNKGNPCVNCKKSHKNFVR